MDKHKIYVTTLAFLLMLTVVSLSALHESRLEVYVSLFTVCYFAASALFRPRRRLPDLVGGALFLVFIYIVAMKVMEILSP
jgi:hypothetical protein